jgi:four helix bundle protein
MDKGSRPRDITDRTFYFAAEIIRFCDALDSSRGTVRVLARQLLRAGTSIGANVEEAQAGQSRADFISKYSIALKEARESIYWLRLLKTAGVYANGESATSRGGGANCPDYWFDHCKYKKKVAEVLTFTFLLLLLALP